MTQLRERARAEITGERSTFGIATIAEAVGAVAAAVGAYMYYAPSGGVLEFLGWSWTVGDLSVQWALGLMVAGGLLMAVGFTMTANLFHRRRGWSGITWTMATLAVLALAGAVTYGLIWIF